jgi:AcrR family transcriptional regulator
VSGSEITPPDDEPVRQKASHRKGRTAEVRRSPRVPTQERSRRRYQAIIEATEYLLQTANIEDISLYDIGKQSKIAPASVHYLFNTVTAIHIELNKIYNERLTAIILEQSKLQAANKNPNWQDWVRAVMADARDVLNNNRAMSEIMLGPTLHRQSRLNNLMHNKTFGQASLEVMREAFVMPEIPNLERYFMFSTELGEALWSGSYSARGKIDDETFTESVRATLAYLRCFLPETLVLKERQAESAA